MPYVTTPKKTCTGQEKAVGYIDDMSITKTFTILHFSFAKSATELKLQLTLVHVHVVPIII